MAVKTISIRAIRHSSEFLLIRKRLNFKEIKIVYIVKIKDY